MEGSVLSILPSVITIVLIIFTRKIFLSLGIGILLGALLINGWNPVNGVITILELAKGVLEEEWGILLFVLLVGIMTSLIYISGGIKAFSVWSVEKVKSRVLAQLITVVLGIFLFFDDACNSLLRGNVLRPMTDELRISRAKLSYLIHSSTATISLLFPISGIGAATAVIVGGVLMDNGITDYGGFEAFLLAIFTNYYAITCLLLVFAVAIFGLNIGQMKRVEKLAVEKGILSNDTKVLQMEEKENELYVRKDGTIADLLLPVAALIGSILLIGLWDGLRNIEGPVTLSGILTSMNVVLVMVYGGIIACLVSTVRLLLKRTNFKQIISSMFSGAKTTLPSVMILFLALITAETIKLLGVGAFLAGVFEGSIMTALFPVLFFILAAIMCFSTGSTFGTLILLIPIGGEIIATIEPSFFITTLGAIIAGAIFGEHSSPLSDTTILSSIGSRIHPIDHVTTQLPYALICTGVSVIGYLILGFTNNQLFGLVTTILLLVLVVFMLHRFTSRNTNLPIDQLNNKLEEIDNQKEKSFIG